MRTWLLSSLSALVLAGCAGDGEEVDVAGSWSGTSSSGQHFSLTLAQSGSTVTGSGVISPGNITGQPFSATIAGALTDDGGIAITLDTGNGSVSFSGAVMSNDWMQGQLDGSGWAASPIDFTR